MSHSQGNDTRDPFLVLTSSEHSSSPVFKPTQSSDSPIVTRAPSDTDFGPFVSVSTEIDPLSTTLDNLDATNSIPPDQIPTAPHKNITPLKAAERTSIVTPQTQVQSQNSVNPTGLGTFGVEAKRRAKENEQRVLGELRLFDDTTRATKGGMQSQVIEADLPWWLQLGKTGSPIEEENVDGLPNSPAVEQDRRMDSTPSTEQSASTSADSNKVPENATTGHKRRHRSRSTKPHTPHATPEGSPPSSPSPSSSSMTASENDHDEDEHSKQIQIRKSRASAARYSPPVTTASSSTSSFFGNTPTRSWFSSLLSPTRVVPALPSASSLVKPISVPFSKSDENQRSSSLDRGQRRGRVPLRRSPTEERLAAFVAASSHNNNNNNAQPQSVPPRTRSELDHVVRQSPFAAHSYVPPSGAPGFMGDREWNTGGFEFEDEGIAKRRGRIKSRVGVGKGVKLVGRRESTIDVLDEALADELRPHLPPLARLPHTWTLLYSLDQDGISLNTLYTNCARAFAIPVTSSRTLTGASSPHANHGHGHARMRTGGMGTGLGGVVVENGSAGLKAPPPGSEGMLLVIRDGEDGVFGAWTSDGVRLSHGSYYGGGDSFLFSAPDGADGNVNVYKWTGRNNFVALCDPEYISFGGGDGHYGLYVGASLLEGTTHRCPTFDNEPLAKGEQVGDLVTFDCVGVEVWGVGG